MFSKEILIVTSLALGVGLFAAGAAGEGKVQQIKVVADKAADSSSLKSIVESVTRGCTTNDEKAIALYNYCRLMLYHRAYPSEKGGVAALKLFNVYGWSLCGGLHTAEGSLYRQIGWKWHYMGWRSPGHTTIEAFYDGQWHYFDVFLKFWVWKDDPNAPGGRTVASQADIKAHPELVTQDLVPDPARKPAYRHKGNEFEMIGDKANWTAPAFLVCGDGPEGVISGVNSNRDSGSPTGWMGIKFDEGGYNTDVNLGPGMSLELMWKTAGKDAKWWNGKRGYSDGHGCRDKEYRNCPSSGPVLEPYIDSDPNLPNGGRARNWANGYLVFEPDWGGNAFLKTLSASDNVKWVKGKLAAANASRPASITVELQSPYVMSMADGKAEGADVTAELSSDGGKTFKAIDLADFSNAVGGKYAVQVKVGFKELTALRLAAVVQHNRCALPYLSPGKNKITVSAANPGQLAGNKVVVTYAYALGSRNRSYEEICDRGAELGRAHYATWSKTPTVVQKVFAAKDLPATFEIDCPTPKKLHPVYPRMLFLRREVIAADGKPMALPAGAEAAKPVGPDEELKTLPNPFLVGIAKPPAKVVRPSATRRIDLKAGHVVDMEGKTYDEHFIKWASVSRGSPTPKEAYVMLVGGDLGKLPGLRDIAGATLCVPLTDAHRKGTTCFGAAVLKKPFEAGKAYDFKDLGGVAATANVPPQDAPGEAKYIKLDITRAVKDVAAGEAKFNGLALRIVPNIGVDEGWTTRVDVAKDQPIYIELEYYTDAK